MRENKKTSYPVKLECGDSRYFLPTYAPNPGEPVWCPRCQSDTVAAETPRIAAIEGDWRSVPLADGRYLAECLRAKRDGTQCTWKKTTKRGWYELERMVNHHLLGEDHTSGRFQSRLEVRSVSYEPNATPPF